MNSLTGVSEFYEELRYKKLPLLLLTTVVISIKFKFLLLTVQNQLFNHGVPACFNLYQVDATHVL